MVHFLQAFSFVFAFCTLFPLSNKLNKLFYSGWERNAAIMYLMQLPFFVKWMHLHVFVFKGYFELTKIRLYLAWIFSLFTVMFTTYCCFFSLYDVYSLLFPLILIEQAIFLCSYVFVLIDRKVKVQHAPLYDRYAKHNEKEKVDIRRAKRQMEFTPFLGVFQNIHKKNAKQKALQCIQKIKAKEADQRKPKTTNTDER